VDAPLRRLVLTTPAFFDIFTRRTIGAISSDIAVVCVPLPPDIQAKVDGVGRVASREVTPAAAAAAVASEIEPQLHDCSRIAPFPRATSSRSRAEPIREINSAIRSGTGAGDPRLPPPRPSDVHAVPETVINHAGGTNRYGNDARRALC
jgi:hypothetical protein